MLRGGAGSVTVGGRVVFVELGQVDLGHVVALDVVADRLVGGVQFTLGCLTAADQLFGHPVAELVAVGAAVGVLEVAEVGDVAVAGHRRRSFSSTTIVAMRSASAGVTSVNRS